MATKPHPHERIWRTVLAVPEGYVASYGQIADLAGLPGRARMVGKALGFAPDDLQVPWYRIVRSDGRIAFPAGSEYAERQKQQLLEEGVVVLKNRIKMHEFGWKPDLAELLMKLEF
ncbi:MAG: MGMT family protein [Sedimenticola sp.]|jgi:methylated-DNA-protein-cysteine methyltransferase-like protein|nr:MGMT family protein [Sedimenticola sp.]